MDAYDADVDQKTEAKLADIRASLEKEKQAELSSLKEAAARTVLNLEKEYAENISQEFTEFSQHLLELPLGQYVKRIYATERNARVDWRGM